MALNGHCFCFDPLEGHLAATRCGHVFHRKCIEEALKAAPKCPMCRSVCHLPMLIDIHYSVADRLQELLGATSNVLPDNDSWNAPTNGLGGNQETTPQTVERRKRELIERARLVQADGRLAEARQEDARLESVLEEANQQVAVVEAKVAHSKAKVAETDTRLQALDRASVDDVRRFADLHSLRAFVRDVEVLQSSLMQCAGLLRSLQHDTYANKLDTLDSNLMGPPLQLASSKVMALTGGLVTVVEEGRPVGSLLPPALQPGEEDRGKPPSAEVLAARVKAVQARRGRKPRKNGLPIANEEEKDVSTPSVTPMFISPPLPSSLPQAQPLQAPTSSEGPPKPFFASYFSGAAAALWLRLCARLVERNRAVAESVYGEHARIQDEADKAVHRELASVSSKLEETQAALASTVRKQHVAAQRLESLRAELKSLKTAPLHQPRLPTPRLGTSIGGGPSGDVDRFKRPRARLSTHVLPAT